MNIKSILLTRFNVSAFGTKTNFDEVCAWMLRRIDIFNRFTLPSIKAQTYQDFIWLCLFDERTPDIFIKWIEEQKEYSNFKAFYCEPSDVEQFETDVDFSCIGRSAVKAVNEHLDGSEDYVITTWFDNDDILHKNFMRDVQRNISKVHKATLNFRNGYTVCIRDTAPVIRSYTSASNQFISLIECPDDLNTVFHVRHKVWQKRPNHLDVDTYPLWIWLLHKDNITKEYIPPRGIRTNLTLDDLKHQGFNFTETLNV